MSKVPQQVGRGHSIGRAVTLAYAALIVYGSLYPFSGWTDSSRGLLDFLGRGLRGQLHGADALINVLAYVPFGVLLARRLGRRGSPVASATIATLAGAALSFTMEFLQQFLPSRVASIDDLITNTLGTLVGAIVAGFVRLDVLPVATLVNWRNQWFRQGRLADLGLAAIGLWALSQTTPLVPSLDIGELRHGLAPLWQTLQHPVRFDVAQWATYALDIAGLALLARTLANSGKSVAMPFAGFVAAVLLYKVPVVTRQLSMEALAGALAALVIALPLFNVPRKPLAWLGTVLILGGFAVDELRADPTGPMFRFAWIPFSAQLEHPLIGIASILENLWPAAALAYLARFATAPRYRFLIAAGGGLLLAMIAFGLEWHQQTIPGRIGDITTVLLMVAAWGFVWGARVDDTTPDAEQPPPVETPLPRKTRRRLIGWGLGAMATAGIGTAALSNRARESRVDESRLPRLPRPQDLPSVSLPQFRLAHPRLPHPSPSDLETLLADSHDFVRELRRRANGGRGDIDAVALQALMEPGIVDLEILFQRLMALKFTWRGHEQGKPLALAYDWLYPLWTDTQRRQLRDKLADGCEYLIAVVRNDRLSPYNVILYNSPFQALMACTLALTATIRAALYDEFHRRPVEEPGAARLAADHGQERRLARGRRIRRHRDRASHLRAAGDVAQRDRRGPDRRRTRHPRLSGLPGLPDPARRHALSLGRRGLVQPDRSRCRAPVPGIATRGGLQPSSALEGDRPDGLAVGTAQRSNAVRSDGELAAAADQGVRWHRHDRCSQRLDTRRHLRHLQDRRQFLVARPPRPGRVHDLQGRRTGHRQRSLRSRLRLGPPHELRLPDDRPRHDHRDRPGRHRPRAGQEGAAAHCQRRGPAPHRVGLGRRGRPARSRRVEQRSATSTTRERSRRFSTRTD